MHYFTMSLFELKLWHLIKRVAATTEHSLGLQWVHSLTLDCFVTSSEGMYNLQ